MPQNRFVFDAHTTATDGRFPIPPLGADATELLCALLEHAVARSPRLQRHDFRIELGTLDAVSAPVLHEVLATPFSIPMEGCEIAVATLEHASIVGGELRYAIHPTYAAYLMFTAPEHALLRETVPVAGHVLAGTVLTDREHALVIAGLQSLHRERVVAWNCHAVHALSNGSNPSSPDEFGIAEAAGVLRKLGASPHP